MDLLYNLLLITSELLLSIFYNNNLDRQVTGQEVAQ